MRNSSIFFLFLLISFKGFTQCDYSSASSELTYRWVSDSTYEFTLLYYRNCDPSFACSPLYLGATIESSSKSLNTTFTTNLPMLPTIGTNVPTIQTDDMVSCSGDSRCNCQNGLNQLCLEEFVHRYNITLPGKASDWTFKFLKCCMPDETDNVQGPMFAMAGLDNLNFPDSMAQNSSPIWHDRRPNTPGYLNDTIINYPYRVFCQKRTYLVKQGAIERQGDRIKYEFISPEPLFVDSATSGPAIKYRSPYSLTNILPLDSSQIGLQIDSNSGFFMYKPDSFQDSGIYNAYLVCIKATEYRFDSVSGREKQIGFTIRNLMIQVTPDSLCPDSAITFSDTLNPSVPADSVALLCDDNPFKIALTERISCISVDTNASCFLLLNSTTGDTLNITKAKPIYSNYQFESKFIQLYFDSPLPMGAYQLFIKTGDDGNSIMTECGSEIKAFNDTLVLVVYNGPEYPTLLKNSSGLDINSLEAICRSWTMIVYPSYPISCKSLSINGSEFYLVDSSQNPPKVAGIKKVIKGICQNGFLEDFTLRFDSPIDPGNYKLYLIKGSDGNTLVDACHRKWPYLVTDVSVPNPELDIGPDYQFCSRDTFTIRLSLPQGINGQWSTGAYRNSISVNAFGSYWVKMITPNGCSAVDTVHITELNCTGIEEALGGADFTIFPNPSSGQFTIEFRKASSGKLIIQSSIGSLVYSENIQDKEKTTITLPSSITEGFYVVKFETEEGVFSQSLVLRKE